MNTMEEKKAVEEEGKGPEKPQIIKVKLSGSEHPVATLSQETDPGGLSLVCPFPSLRLDTPIEVQVPSADGSVTLRQARLRKIGVMVDPEIGLPRMSLRVEFVPDVEPVSKVEPIPEVECTSPKLSEQPAVEGAWTVGEITELKDEDPPWSIQAAEFTLPEEYIALKPKKGRHLGSMVFSAVALIVAVCLGGFGLYQARVIDPQGIRAWIEGLDMVRHQAGLAFKDLMTPAQQPQAILVSRTASVMKPVVKEPLQIKTAGFTLETPVAPEPVASENVLAPTDQASASQPVDKGPDILLKTKWPVEYAKAYRLKSPNGVVIDVPGAISPWKDGYVRLSHPFVKCAKVAHIEGGVRFILYTEGEDLPNFTIGYKAQGVSIRLL